MKIEVTQDDIDNGLRIDCELCPVAKAIVRATGKQARVSAVGVFFFPETPSAKQIFLPSKVQLFIKSFDRKEPVQPFSFDLDIEVNDE